MTPKEANVALLKAARDGDVEALKEALAAGADVNKAKDSLHDSNALDLVSGYVAEPAIAREMIKILLDAGIEDAGAIGEAVRHFKTENISLLLEAGLDVNACEGYAIRMACERSSSGDNEEDDLAVVKMLLDAGADPNMCSSTGTPVLASAVECEYKRVVELLLSVGTKVDPKTMRKAIVWNRIELMELLLKAGGTVDEASLRELASENNLEMLRLLLEHGVDAQTIKEADDKTSLFELAVFEWRKTKAAFVKGLIEAGANVNREKKNRWDNTVLYTVIKSTLERWEQVTRREDAEKAAAYQATVLEIIRLLLEAGAAVEDANEAGEKPLKLAATHGNAAVVKMLLEAGAEVESANAQNVTALMMAVESGNPEVVKMLLEAGANANAESTFGSKAQVKSSCPQPQKKELQDMLKEARAALRAAAKAAAKEAAAASGEPKAAPKKACAAKSTAKKTTGTKSTTTKKTTE